MPSYPCFFRRRLSKCAARQPLFVLMSTSQIKLPQANEPQSSQSPKVLFSSQMVLNNWLYATDNENRKLQLHARYGKTMRPHSNLRAVSARSTRASASAHGEVCSIKKAKKPPKNNTIYPKIPWDFSQLKLETLRSVIQLKSNLW